MTIDHTDQALLIEVGTEELPPARLAELAQLFAQKITQGLTALGFSLTASDAQGYATPRRLAVLIHGIPPEQPTRQVRRKGPALSAAFDPQGTPTQAALGFAKSCGVPIASLGVEETPQGSWLLFTQEEKGEDLNHVLPGLIEEALNTLPNPKRMRWGNGEVTFLRPIHWICAVHHTTALNFNVFNITSNGLTRGHRFHAPQAVTVTNAKEYLSLLKEHYVIADQAERRTLILQAIETLADKLQGTAVIDPQLLEEVTGLVEWPTPLVASFSETLLSVPPEALISSMQNHQKCFPVLDHNGKLLPRFIIISNVQAPDPSHIIQGNERVMHARLADAKFFYDQDRKTPLVQRLEGLKNMVFQKKLGTLYDKSYRISKLAALIAQKIGAPVDHAEKAGRLCKADLLTDMVFEFPELQGIMGSYYALHDHAPNEVALAIRESYLPRFAKDSLPNSPLGMAVSLADRLDSLIGIFGIGQGPSKDKDPFALRRQALAVIRLLVEKALPLDLGELLTLARQGYGSSLIDEEILNEVSTFCFERFKAWYQEQGISPQSLEAVMANNISEPYDCSQRVLAVDHFQQLPAAQHLAAANKRVRNLLQKEGFSFNPEHPPAISPSLLIEAEEIALASAIEELRKQTAPLIAEKKYQEALVQLAALQAPVDHFFDKVMVMTEDKALRNNRVHLLMQLYGLFMRIADISKLAL